MVTYGRLTAVYLPGFYLLGAMLVLYVMNYCPSYLSNMQNLRFGR